MSQIIYLAGGCFWGVAEYYRRLKGIVEVEVGYAQGTVENPRYQEVCTGRTHHTETVKVTYDLPLEKVIEHFFRMIDPTTLNKQGNDIGTQYRSGIYTTNAQDVEKIRTIVSSYQQFYTKPIVVEVEELKSYYPAEEYHQDYLVKNPSGYCHINFNLIKPEELRV